MGRKSSLEGMFFFNLWKVSRLSPSCGWLRIACTYLKRQVDGDNWMEKVDDKVKSMLNEILERVRKEGNTSEKSEEEEGSKG